MAGFSFFVFSVPFLKPDLQGKASFKTINGDQTIFHQDRFKEARTSSSRRKEG
jgi:hypothetical protein